MANIHKGKKKLQPTLNEMNHVHPDKKGIIYMNRDAKPTQEEVEDGRNLAERLFKEEVEGQNLILNKQMEEAKTYNESINNHLPMYDSFQPNETILIRFFRREPRISESGLILNEATQHDYARMERIAATGSTYTQRQQPTEFKFLAKAVVVANGSYSEKYKKGDIITTYQPIIKGVAYDGGEHQVFDNYFVHPDSGLVIPPQKPSPHYGYALVPISFIKGKNGTL